VPDPLKVLDVMAEERLVIASKGGRGARRRGKAVEVFPLSLFLASSTTHPEPKPKPNPNPDV